MRKQQLAIVLHSHMPYVEGFGTWPFGEEWLWEAIATCYLPLTTLLKDNPPLTLSITPVLADQLSAHDIQPRLRDFLQKIRRETHRLDILSATDPALQQALRYSEAQYLQAEETWEQINGDLLRTLRPYAHWTSSATHAILPLLASGRGIHLQIETGTHSHSERFGDWRGGFWLPECAYAAWLDTFLADAGVHYTCVDLTDSFGYGSPHHLTPQQTAQGVWLAPIDRQTMELVWSDHGYPRHGAYRDHHRLTRHDHRAWANDGAPYDPTRAEQTARKHAHMFIQDVKKRLRDGGLVTCAFDTEFFGHWWHEGLTWLAAVIDTAADEGIELIRLDNALNEHRASSLAQKLPISSWGKKRNLSTWDQPAVAEMVWQARTLELKTHYAKTPASLRALRELLLLQSSDWTFLVTQNYAASYGQERAKSHAKMLRQALKQPELDPYVRNLAPFLCANQIRS